MEEANTSQIDNVAARTFLESMGWTVTLPTQAAPTGAAPTATAPTGAAPTAVARTGAAPTAVARTGAAPTAVARTAAPELDSPSAKPDQT
eukprot:6209330-Pleurochrysis_carterae.AAC.1